RTMKPCCPGSSTRLSNCAYSHRKDVVNQALTVQFKDVTWSAMNSYVHSGIHPLRRHAEGYPLPLVLQILQSSNGLLTMTGMVAAILTGDERCIEPMRKIQTRFSDCLPELLAPQR
ncbi:DUF6988 family protein, partial [Pseudomonas nitroreducens]|uniref:DUF6988 family protein n=1 Tax=Pseudomonas nitroreducens TaxID=46680 RepID=UPI0039088F08